MGIITRDSLLSHEAYYKESPAFREKAIQERRLRRVHLGDHVTMIFVSEFLMRYTLQATLRPYTTHEEAGIQDELNASNPLVTDGSTLKATKMSEYPNEADPKVPSGYYCT